MRNCPVCREPVDPEAERCPSCGSALPPPEDEHWRSLAGTPVAWIAAEPPEGDYPDPDDALPPPDDPTHTAHGTPVSLLATEPPECDDGDAPAPPAVALAEPESPKEPGPAELSNRAVAAVEAGQFDAAFADFERSLELAPGAAETWFRLGGAYYRVRAYRHAAAAFERALALNQAHPRAGYWRAQARAAARGPEPAVPELITPPPDPPGAPDEPALPLAGPSRRLPAFVADAALIAFVLFMAHSTVVAAAYLFPDPHTSFLHSGFYALGRWIAALYIVLAYFAVFHATLGQTPGMMLLGLRLVDRRGEAPGYAASLLRTVFFGLFSCLSLLSALLSRGRSLHDWMCGTYVVHAD